MQGRGVRVGFGGGSCGLHPAAGVFGLFDTRFERLAPVSTIAGRTGAEGVAVVILGGFERRPGLGSGGLCGLQRGAAV